MSDGLILGLALILLIVLFLVMFRKPIAARITAGGVDTGFQLPLGAKIWAKLSKAEKKAAVAEELEIPEAEVEKVAPQEKTQVTWKAEKVGNLYWLASDLMHAVMVAQFGAPLALIIRDIAHIEWHAQELSLDAIILGRLVALHSQVREYTDLTFDERGKVIQELSALINVVGFVAEAADPQFRPERG